MGYHRGNHSSFNGKSQSMTVDAAVISATVSESNKTYGAEYRNGKKVKHKGSVSVGGGYGAGVSGGTTKTSTLLSTKSVIKKLSRVLSYGNDVKIKKGKDGVNITSSKLGTRIKKSVFIPYKKKEK